LLEVKLPAAIIVTSVYLGVYARVESSPLKFDYHGYSSGSRRVLSLCDDASLCQKDRGDIMISKSGSTTIALSYF
jgi:hypothetical protein